MSYLLALIGFAALIVLHEAGHFVAAKAVGMRVERFSLFFGPMIVKTTRGETEYGIGTIPLGGYVKITGMNPREEIPPEVESRAYYRQPVWKRVVVILAGPAVNLLIAFAVLTAIVYSSGVQRTSHGQPVFSRTIAAGSLEQPAASYLEPGDQIVAVDGKRNLSVDQITNEISSHRCAGPPAPGCQATTPVALTVLRHGRPLTFSIRPRYDSSLKRTRIGFGFGVAIEHPNLLGAGDKSLGQMWFVTHKTITTIATIFEPKTRQQVHGIVGGFDVTQQEFSYSATDAFYTLAIISLSLAVINLFPFLPLDGGHVFWALAEKVRGKRIPFEIMERAGAVGFVLIILLFVIGLTNDISTLSGKGFTTR